MGIVVLGAVFVDVKGYPLSTYIPGGRNVGRVEQVPGGVSRNVVEDIANVELRPTFVSLVDDTGMGEDVVRQLRNHKVNTDYILRTPDGMGGVAGGIRQPRRRVRLHLQAAGSATAGGTAGREG